MPFTPFHLGPALLFGLLLFPHLDLPTFLLSNVIVDLEPFLVLVLGLRWPLHGPFHSYTLGTLVALGTALLMLLMMPLTRPLTSLFRLPQDSSPRKVAVTSLLGLYLHLTLDAFLYSEMNLLYPLRGNPLLGLASLHAVYQFCTLCFPLALLLYLYRLLSPRRG
ncbi:hypothetical protein CW700_02355 [Candidatus Bathyarchaeota archaeon]|nr:MAG: hypothetical protein CW700_02355 [Candidatus Bathyarchaeota archaeon]